MRRTASIACGIGMLMGIASGANASSPATPPSGRIAFASDRLAIKLESTGPVCYSANCSDIYVVNTDGTGLRRITPSSLTGFENTPSWSPDGTTIAFERTFKGYRGHPSHQIYEMDADGGDVTQITSGNELSVHPSWSPDGGTIAFVRRPRVGPSIPYGHIALMNPDGTHVSEITDGTDYDQHPEWSPDGTRIVFERDFACFCEAPAVYVVNRDGSGATRLIDGSGPAWSPDGTRISFWDDTDQLLRVLELSSHTVTTLATVADVGGDPSSAGVYTAWSPDGRWITVAGQGDVSGGAPLVLVAADGSAIVRVPNGDDAMAPAWQP
jgi:TolB protein